MRLRPPAPDPIEQAKITNAEKDLIGRWFADKAEGKIKCPVCQTDRFVIGDNFASPITLNGERNSLALFGRSVMYPHFMLMCTNCSHTLFINAVNTNPHND